MRRERSRPLPGEGHQASSAEVERLCRAGQWQAAIDAAVAVHGIDASNINGHVAYDPTLAEEGVTSPDRRVRIGRAAFRSAAWLASTIAHEVEVHVNRQAMVGRWYIDPEGAALQEVEAYDYEIRNAARFGLSRAEIEDLQRRRTFYYNWLSPAYQAKADAGDYTQ